MSVPAVKQVKILYQNYAVVIWRDETGVYYTSNTTVFLGQLNVNKATYVKATVCILLELPESTLIINIQTGDRCEISGKVTNIFNQYMLVDGIEVYDMKTGTFCYRVFEADKQEVLWYDNRIMISMEIFDYSNTRESTNIINIYLDGLRVRRDIFHIRKHQLGYINREIINVLYGENVVNVFLSLNNGDYTISIPCI